MPEIQLQAAFKMPPQFVSYIPKSCGGDIIHEMASKCHLIYTEEWGKRKDLFYVNFFYKSKTFPEILATDFLLGFIG